MTSVPNLTGSSPVAVRITYFVLLWSLLSIPSISRVSSAGAVWSAICFIVTGSFIFQSTPRIRLQRVSSAFLIILLLIAPVLPLWHVDLLRVALASFAAFSIVKGGYSTHCWGVPIFVVVGGIFAGALWSTFEVLPELIEASGASFTILSALVTTIFPVWQPLADLTVLVVLIGAIPASASGIWVRLALLTGAIMGAGVTVLQRYLGWDFLLQNQSSFWRDVGRFPGSFSDPNAQGLYLFITIVFGLLPLWKDLFASRYHGTRNGILLHGLLLIALLLVTYGGLLSGSRSFFLGIGLWVALSSLMYRKIAIVLALLLLCSVVALGSAVDFLISPDVAQQYLGPLPTGVRRVIESASLGRIKDTFFSRTVFLEMGLVALQENGVWGIGPGRFRYFSPALASIAGYDLKGWADNSNNFYIGLLVEFGVIGVLAFATSVLMRTRRQTATVSDRRILYCILVLLLTGPHVEAPEVALLYAVLVGVGTAQKWKNREKEGNAGALSFLSRLTTYTVIFAGAAMAEATRDFGSYAWEREGHGMHQWLGPVARIQRSCDCRGQAIFTIEVAKASTDIPVEVKIRNNFGASVRRQFTRPGVQKMELSCVETGPQEGKLNVTYPYQSRAVFHISVDRAWSPIQNGNSDPRVFGARVRERTPEDLLTHPPCPSPVSQKVQ